MIPEQASLFGPPLPAPLPSVEERPAVLAQLPVPAPAVRLPLIPRAWVDPIGHLSDCQEEDCPDCALLRLDFSKCSKCGRWTYTPCLYSGGLCLGCQARSGEYCDDRMDRCRWVPPAGLRRER